MIDTERMNQYLLDLIRIDSTSREERDVAQKLKKDLEALGATVEIDDAGEKAGGNTGNVIARVPGSGAAPLLLCSHMDTVVPGKGIRPRIEGQRMVTDGSTVLGGDDKSGCAILIEVLRTAREKKVPLPPLELVFTICEESGLLGAKYLDVKRLEARRGLVLDSDAASCLFTEGPASDRMEFTVHGLEAHAGMAPEKGINAIKIAAEGLAAMRLGRLDEETTSNIGLISGGMAVNIVPNRVDMKGEARSRDLAKLDAQTAHMRQCLQDAAKRHTVKTESGVVTARVEEKLWRDYDRLYVSADSEIVKLVLQAAKSLGQTVETAAMGGGCDANIFNMRGLEVANLGTGMRDIHTVKEWLDIPDFHRSGRLVLELVRLAA